MVAYSMLSMAVVPAYNFENFTLFAQVVREWGRTPFNVHVENNDVLATSFGAMHPGSFYGRRMHASFK